MKQEKPNNTSYQARTAKGLVRLACWAGAWVAATALMKFGPTFLWDKPSPLTLVAIGLNFCVGFGLIVAQKNYIADLDELQQKIYLNALGITVGVGVIGGAPFAVMSMYGVIPFHAEIAHLVGLMGLTFLASMLYGSVRYR